MQNRAATTQHIERAFQELRGWYHEVPALDLTVREASALVSLDVRVCVAVLDALVHSHFLERTALGTYVRRGHRRIANSPPTTAERFWPYAS